MNRETFVKYAIMVFGVLGVLIGIGLIGFGAILLSNIEEDDSPLVDIVQEKLSEDAELRKYKTEKDQRALAKFGIRTLAIVYIISGIVYIIDGLIAVTGSLKENRNLLTIHSVLLVICVSSGLYNIFAHFSVTSLFVVVIFSLRLGLLFYFLKFLKTRDQAERTATIALYQYNEETKINN